MKKLNREFQDLLKSNADGQENNIIFHVPDVAGKLIKILRISPEGFFLRDSEESVAPENEAREVYEAIKLFISGRDLGRRRSFRAEYIECLKSRDEMYLAHDREVLRLQKKISELEAREKLP